MPVLLYNSLTREKQEFAPLEPGVVRMYNCGPTVYSRAHIGNFRAFLFADLLRRWLEERGFEVRQVMNITDVGHMTGDDEDAGVDSVEAQAKREGRDPKAISEHYTELFFRDLEALGVKKAFANPRATEYIAPMLEMIEGLIAKGLAYQVGGNVYFEVSKFPAYGRLSGNRVEDLDAGARVEVNREKRHPADFALWKSDPAHLMKWESRFGPDGFPGWHIECSAMARALLGDRIDIHTGGEDNVFPHHECEIAQSEGLLDHPFATIWMHTKFLQVDGGKMSKSLGNVYSVDDVVARGFEPRALRFALLRGHYRSSLNFTWDALQGAKSELQKLDDLARRLRVLSSQGGKWVEGGAGRGLVAELRAEFEAALDDDLNVPRALAPLHNLRSALLEGRVGGPAARAGLEFVLMANRVLGVLHTEEDSLDAEIQALIAARDEARRAKDWAASDRIRDELLARDIVLEDTPDGVTWRRRTS